MPQHDERHLWPAVEAHLHYHAYAAADVHCRPVFQEHPACVLLVLERDDGGRQEGRLDLPSVRMTGQDEVDAAPTDVREAVGIVHQEQNRLGRSVDSFEEMSRALAGTMKGKVIFCLPGSPRACKLALESLILPELGHIRMLLESH